MADQHADIALYEEGRRNEARRRLTEAFSRSVGILSDVFYDAAYDQQDMPDGEGGWHAENYGYDCDDLAAVLWPLLKEHFDGTERG